MKNFRNMKNKRGFTLIELLAVIVILGILMLVAIPAVSRTIENARRDTFMNTAKSYINAVKNAVAADELKCGDYMISALGTGYYQVVFNSSMDSGKDLMEQGGKSSWGNAEVKGVVLIQKTVDRDRNVHVYSIFMTDSQGRGIGGASNTNPTALISESALARSHVKTKDGDNRKTVFGKVDDEIATVPANATVNGESIGETAPTVCVVDM